jgi:Lecithin retinol acyltransferase
VSDNLSIGAHLVSPRRGYLHHGLYAGNGRVIHYGGFNRLFEKRPVEEISLEEFTRGRGLGVKAWVAPKFNGADVIERARTRIGENRYRLLSNNCEHFTEWCIGGTSRSPQVDAWKARVKRIARLVRVPSIGNTGSTPLAA